jgi:hypothetical protein
MRPRFQRAAMLGAVSLALSTARPAVAADDDASAAPGSTATSAAAAKGSAATSAPPRGSEEPELMRYPPSSVRLPLVVGGTLVTGAAYAIAALSGSNWDDVPGADALMVPVAGPWIALFQNDCAPNDPDCGAILVLRGILTAVDGLAQLGGLILVAEGLFMTTEAAGPDSASVNLTVTPIITPHQAGVGVVGSF